MSRPRSWVALDITGGDLELVHAYAAGSTYRIRPVPDGDEPSAPTVLINLSDDERAQWAATLLEFHP